MQARLFGNMQSGFMGNLATKSLFATAVLGFNYVADALPVIANKTIELSNTLLNAAQINEIASPAQLTTTGHSSPSESDTEIELSPEAIGYIVIAGVVVLIIGSICRCAGNNNAGNAAEGLGAGLLEVAVELEAGRRHDQHHGGHGHGRNHHGHGHSHGGHGRRH